MFSPGCPDVPGTKIFYTTADNKSKEEFGPDSVFYFFFTLFEVLDLDEVRELVEREGEERVIREREGLRKEREEELLDVDTRPGE